MNDLNKTKKRIEIQSSSVADPGCLSRIRIFPSRIPGQKDSGSASKNLSILAQKIVSKLSENNLGCSSRIKIQIFNHPGSGTRIQGSKKHRITDPPH
jgi:hypothetical protein